MWQDKLPQASSPTTKALRHYCNAVISCISHPASSVTQRELDERAQELGATLQLGESRAKLQKLHANTLLLKRIIASYFREFLEINQLR